MEMRTYVDRLVTGGQTVWKVAGRKFDARCKVNKPFHCNLARYVLTITILKPTWLALPYRRELGFTYVQIEQSERKSSQAIASTSYGQTESQVVASFNFQLVITCNCVWPGLFVIDIWTSILLLSPLCVTIPREGY